jgi:hypothetical protein
MPSVGVVFVDERGYCVSGLLAGGKVVPAEQLELQVRPVDWVTPALRHASTNRLPVYSPP